jgi:meso-butanediol dehydrogenase/(S,S)-butanediol dehydrogenase/diacetyl reductase
MEIFRDMTYERNYINLAGKVAVVTGAGAGIGVGIAERLAQAGADVVVADIDRAGASKTAEGIKALGVRSEALSVDVRDQASTDEMIKSAISSFGKVDILVNNAGVGGAPGWTERGFSSVDDWEAVFEVNVLGIVHASNSVKDHMVERGSGKIVNIASAAGRRGSPGFSHYSASKASAINITQAWAYQLAPLGINVNSVCPGVIWTNLWHNISKRRLGMIGDTKTTGREYFEGRLPGIPLGREQTPEDIGNAVVFLASERARSITGQALNVDGGSQMN